MAWFRSRSRSRKSDEPKGVEPAPSPAFAVAAGPPPDHTLRAFTEALAGLSAGIDRMGQLVAGMVSESALVFLARDAAKAKAIIERDLAVDSQKDALLAQALEVLARHQPVATDLRLLLAIEHIARDLERSADHAKNIAKRTLSLTGPATLDPAIADLIRRLHADVTDMFTDSLKAFSSRDSALAMDIARRDAEPDAINDDLFHAVIAKIEINPKEAATDVQALFVGKGLERIGDHATNIAEETRFLARGVPPSATREH